MPDVQFRFSKQKGVDDDLKLAFKNVSNRTERAKELIRLGLEYEALKRVQSSKTPIVQDVAVREPLKPVTWSFPKEPSIKEKKVYPSHSSVKANILAGFD